MSAITAPFDLVPDDVLLLIFKNLKYYDDLLNIICTCKRFHVLVKKHPHMLKGFVLTWEFLEPLKLSLKITVMIPFEGNLLLASDKKIFLWDGKHSQVIHMATQNVIALSLWKEFIVYASENSVALIDFEGQVQNIAQFSEEIVTAMEVWNDWVVIATKNANVKLAKLPNMEQWEEIYQFDPPITPKLVPWKRKLVIATPESFAVFKSGEGIMCTFRTPISIISVYDDEHLLVGKSGWNYVYQMSVWNQSGRVMHQIRSAKDGFIWKKFFVTVEGYSGQELYTLHNFQLEEFFCFQLPVGLTLNKLMPVWNGYLNGMSNDAHYLKCCMVGFIKK